MNNLETLDIMIRGGAIALLALFAWLFIRDHWTALPARIGVAMLVSIMCHVLATMPGDLPFGIVLNWLLLFGAAIVPGLFWLFARTWFNDESRIGWLSWAIVLILPAALATALTYYGKATPSVMVIAIPTRILSFILAIAGLWAAWRGRADDLIEARRRLRLQLIWAVGGFVIFTNFAEVLVNTNRAPDILRSVIEVGILALTATLCGAMFGFRQPDLFAGNPRAAAPEKADDAWMPALAMRLAAHMEQERAYRDDGLTIAKLAAVLGEQEYRLRRLINGHLGHRNFAAFLSGYRLGEVKAALSDEAQAEVPILTIALDAGFGSLGPFNRAFRDAQGCTPSEYRRRALAILASPPTH